MKLFTIRLYTSNADVQNIILNYLYKKKILKNFYEINYKSDNAFVIIKTSTTIKDLEKILSRKYKNLFKMEPL